jgi:hypothetical protein
VQRVLGVLLYEYLSAHPEVGALFDRTTASYARYRVGPAVAAYDFRQFGTIVDVGRERGSLTRNSTHESPAARDRL